MMQRHLISSAARSSILNASEMSACPRPFPENRRSTASRASRIRGKSYFFGKASRGAPAMASVKYPMTVRGAPSSIATKVHTDRAFLLIRPSMPLEIVRSCGDPFSLSLHVCNGRVENISVGELGGLVTGNCLLLRLAEQSSGRGNPDVCLVLYTYPPAHAFGPKSLCAKQS